MHCVSLYPCPEEKLNLNMIKTLKKNLIVMWVTVVMKLLSHLVFMRTC